MLKTEASVLLGFSDFKIHGKYLGVDFVFFVSDFNWGSC